MLQIAQLEHPATGPIHRVTMSGVTHRFTLLETQDGEWLGAADGAPRLQHDVDDSALWEIAGTRYRHVQSGLLLDGNITRVEGAAIEIEPVPGPEKRPSEYLGELRDQGWTCMTSALAPEIIDGLARVGCVDDYADNTRSVETDLAQHPAVARAIVEPVSLWLTRQYLQVDDIRLGHVPRIGALPPDDGQREVQGWHSDYPYLWGTAVAARRASFPQVASDLHLGIQRILCVSDFTYENGATLYKLGSHVLNQGPPKNWGITTDAVVPGYREKHGLPYDGVDADVIEAPAGSIIIFDARTWHRAGVNRSNAKRGAVLQPIIPSFLMPHADTSAPLKAFFASETYAGLKPRVKKDVKDLLIHRIDEIQGTTAIGTDADLTRYLESDD